MTGRGRARAIVVAAAVASMPLTVAAAGPAGAADPVGSIVTIRPKVNQPRSITGGPDGNVWFTNTADDAIVRITPAGVMTAFHDPSIHGPTDITSGADGRVWFINRSESQPFTPTIGAITPAGVVTAYSSPAISDPRQIARGPDGNVWFTDDAAVLRVSPAGVITPFTGPAITDPRSITAGPDGNVWFFDWAAHALRRMTPGGAVTPVVVPSLSSYYDIPSLTAGPDGNLWLTAGFTITRVTPAGTTTDFAVASPALAIVNGPDGKLWFAERSDGPWSPSSIGTITTGGVLGQHADPSIALPSDLATGPDGNVWYTDIGTGFAIDAGQGIGRVTPAGVVTEFSDVPEIASPMSSTLGPDGNVWVGNSSATTISRVTPAGVVTAFTDARILAPSDMVTGPDGNVWFASPYDDAIGRITTNGVVSKYTGTGIGRPTDITAGPDGNLWFVNAGNASIGRITPAGVVSNFSAGGASGLSDITAGPDGNLWFTAAGSNAATSRLGKVTPAGAVTLLADPSLDRPTAIVAGPDGNLWVGNAGSANPPPAGSIVRVTTAGVFSKLPDPLLGPVGMIVGPDGNIWVADEVTLTASPPWAVLSALVRVTTSGVVTHFPIDGLVTSLAPGSDGNVWFTDEATPSIGHIGTGVPGAPTNVVGSPGNGQVTVSWQAPSSDGGSPITGYTVTASPGGGSCATGGALSCTVSGLTNGVTYSFDVRASSSVGQGPPSRPKVAAMPRTTPGPPTGVTASAGNAAVAVSWTPPAVDGGAPITGYSVTASPGGATCATTTSTMCVVSGLTNSTAYTFTVRAANLAGQGTPSAPTASVTPLLPAGGPRFHALPPARILDTRPGADQTGLAGPFGPAQARELQVAGRGGVPSGATGVVLNITAVRPSAYSFLSVLPDLPASGSPIATSSLNLTPGSVRPNLVMAKLNGAGRLSIYNNSGTVDVLADVVGWLDDGTAGGDSLTSVAPARILDTRPGPDQVGLAGAFGPVQARVLQVTGNGGVPAGATAVVMNVTSVNPSAESFLSLTPDTLAPGQVPATSSLNLAAGEVRPNLVVVKLTAAGQVTIFNNSGSVDVLADVVGYFAPPSGGMVQSVTPQRILDTRPGPDQTGLTGAFGPSTARVLQVAGRAGVPAGAKAVWMNVTSVNPSAASFLSLVPGPLGPGQVPATSNLNLATGQVAPNLVLVKLNVAGQVTIYNNSGTVDVLADVVAYTP